MTASDCSPPPTSHTLTVRQRKSRSSPDFPTHPHLELFFLSNVTLDFVTVESDGGVKGHDRASRMFTLRVSIRPQRRRRYSRKSHRELLPLSSSNASSSSQAVPAFDASEDEPTTERPRATRPPPAARRSRRPATLASSNSSRPSVTVVLGPHDGRASSRWSTAGPTDDG